MMITDRSSVWKIYGFALLSGVLIWLGWPTIGIFPLLWIGFVPLLFGISELFKTHIRWKALHLFLLVFVAHLAWIGLSLKWLHTTSPKTYFIAILLESTSLALAIVPLALMRLRSNNIFVGLYFLTAFLTVEYINQHWMAGTPYFVLGSGYGMNPEMIQFYAYTGVEGGTFFTLLSNVFIWIVFTNGIKREPVKRPLFGVVIALLPFILSPILFKKDLQHDPKIKAAVLHTFIETYSEESHKEPSILINNLWDQSEKWDLSDLELLVWPETIISNLGWVHQLSNDKAYQSIEEKLNRYPKLSICAGGYAFSVVDKMKVDAYSVKDESRGFYYTSHNVAVSLNASGRIPVRSKAVFIPFQERIPFLDQLPFLRNFADLVGANTMVSFYENGDEVHKTFTNKKYVPVLCFESIYPLRMASQANQADLMLILSNEYWNKNLYGSDQYMYTHVGMAIQSRTPILRSCNSGVSVIIDKNGRVLSKKKGEDIGMLRAEIALKTEETVYEQLAGMFYGLGILGYSGLLISGIVKGFFRK